MKKDSKSNIVEANKVREFIKSNREIVDPLQKITPYNFIKSFKGKPLKGIGEFLKHKLKKTKIFIVVMQLYNGKYKLFTVATTKQYFIFENGAYYLDSDMIREETETKMNLLFYHQGISIPMKLDFDIDDLHSQLQESASDVEKAINPSSLRAFINSQVIEKVLQGAEMLKDLLQIKMLVIINTCMTVGLAIIIAKTIGWF